MWPVEEKKKKTCVVAQEWGLKHSLHLCQEEGSAMKEGGERETLGYEKGPPASEKTLTQGSQLDVNPTCLLIRFDKPFLMCASDLQQTFCRQGKLPPGTWKQEEKKKKKRRLHSTTENVDKIRLLF